MNKPIQIVLASRSSIFLEIIHNLLENESYLEIAAEALNPGEIKECLAKTKPEFLFVDNKTLELDIHKILSLITESSPNTRVILFGNHVEDELKLPNFMCISGKTGFSELVQIIRGERPDKNDQAGEIKDLEAYTLTTSEIEIVHLIECGLSNREIAKALSISEKTLKNQLTNIYLKLSIKSRYQLIVYVKRLENRYKSQS